MSNNESKNLHLNIIQEKYQLFRSRLASFLSALSDNNQSTKVQTNLELYDIANDLANILSDADKPYWLRETISFTTEYKNSNTSSSVMSGSGWKLLQRAMKIYTQAMDHDWNSIGNDTETKYDFENIYEKYRNESGLNKLYDELIDTINKIINSNEIDSNKMLNKLNELITMLLQNKNSTYFATLTSWEFIKSFATNTTMEFIKDVPGIKQLHKAYLKTTDKFGISIKKINTHVANDIKTNCNVNIQPLLTYDKEKLFKENNKKKLIK